MKDSNSIYSFSLGAIMANVGFPFEHITKNDLILLLIFVSKTFVAGLLSVLSSDALKKIKDWFKNKKNKNVKH